MNIEIEDILSRTQVISEILESQLCDIENFLENVNIPDDESEKIFKQLEVLSNNIFESFDDYMFIVDSIISKFRHHG